MGQRITLTQNQLFTLSAEILDSQKIEIEEANGGNINVYPDGQEDEMFIIDEKGEIL